MGFGLCGCVQQTPMHLLSPGDREKSVLRILDGSRGEVELVGRGGVRGGGRGREKGVLGYWCKR